MSRSDPTVRIRFFLDVVKLDEPALIQAEPKSLLRRPLGTSLLGIKSLGRRRMPLHLFFPFDEEKNNHAAPMETMVKVNAAHAFGSEAIDCFGNAVIARRDQISYTCPTCHKTCWVCKAAFFLKGAPCMECQRAALASLPVPYNGIISGVAGACGRAFGHALGALLSRARRRR